MRRTNFSFSLYLPSRSISRFQGLIEPAQQVGEFRLLGRTQAAEPFLETLPMGRYGPVKEFPTARGELGVDHPPVRDAPFPPH
jgi:hypothetical protein